MAAIVDLKLFAKNNLKRGNSIACATIEPKKLSIKADNIVKDGELAVGDKVVLFNLPAQCVVKNAFIYVKQSDADSATAQLKVDVGSVAAITSVAVGSASNSVVGSLANKIGTGTGAEVSATVGTAALKGGVYEVVIEFAELGRTLGEYTK